MLLHKSLELASPGGAGRNKTLGQKEFLVLAFSMPQIYEQEKVVEILSTWDVAIATTESLIKNAESEHRALIRLLMVSGRTRRQGRQSKKVSDLVEIRYGKSPKEIFNARGQHPVVGTGGITGYTNSAMAEGPAVVIGRKGTISKPQLIAVPFWPIDTTFYCVPKNSCDIRWFFYAIKYARLEQYSEASGVPSLSRSTVEEVSIRSPNLAEQRRISTILDGSAAQIASQRNVLRLLTNERLALMQQLLTGKRRVKL